MYANAYQAILRLLCLFAATLPPAKSGSLRTGRFGRFLFGEFLLHDGCGQEGADDVFHGSDFAVLALDEAHLGDAVEIPLQHAACGLPLRRRI